jgi:transcriptional regulator with XRE-family HTH domain
MERPKTSDTLVSNLKMLMQAQGITIAQLSKKSGVPLRTIYSVIKKERTPSIELADTLAQAFGLTGWHIIKPNLPYDMIRNGKMEEVEKNFLACEEETQEYVLSVMRRELSK